MKQESRTNINRVKKDTSSPDSFTPPEETETTADHNHAKHL